jgi:Amt family ammonium transporter
VPATLADGKSIWRVNANLASNIDKYIMVHPLVLEQIKAIVVTLLLAVIGTTIIAFIVKAVVGLRPSEEVEVAGLDLAEHGEEGYHAARG